MSTTDRTAHTSPSVPIVTGGEGTHRGLTAGLCGLQMTPEEFDSIDYEDCEPGYRYELIQGVVVVNPIPGEAHDEPNEVLGDMLRAYRKGHPQGRAMDKTMQGRYVHVAGGKRIADRVVWVGLGRRPRVESDVPAIVIEFVSASRKDWLRDYIEKRDEYLAIGVKEYWVIDRFRRKLTVFRPTGAAPAETTVLEAEIYRTPLLPGFELRLTELLEVADEWNDERK